jgi:hypothetical protein
VSAPRDDDECLGFVGLEPALEGRPGRPGELRTSLTLELSPYAQAALARPEVSSLPMSLRLALCVESARWVIRIAEVHGVPEDRVRATLDESARSTPAAQVDLAPITARRLVHYSRQLRGRAIASPRTAPEVRVGAALEVEVPVRLASAWAVAAGHGSLQDWVIAQVESAAGDVVLWEASAAARGETLGEWAQAVCARRMVEVSASPHPCA